ncbi:MAG: hypothetical protein GC185_09360 [Alphaproteobacteria bacterium]|nr:hypothetical protein [Alphaproteobacteria bacterium]
MFVKRKTAASLFALCVLFYATVPARAADTPPQPKAEANTPAKDVPDTESPAEKAYFALVDQAVQDPDHADWCKIRELYADTPFYRAHGAANLRRDTAKAAEPVITDNTRENEVAFNVYLRQNFGSVGSHVYADTLYKLNTYGFIDDALHLKAQRGLMDCIINTGDSKTPETALHVISTEEMETVAADVFDMNPRAAQLMKKGGKVYLELMMKNEAGTKRHDAYFVLDDRLVRLIEKEKRAHLGAP